MYLTQTSEMPPPSTTQQEMPQPNPVRPDWRYTAPSRGRSPLLLAAVIVAVIIISAAIYLIHYPGSAAKPSVQSSTSTIQGINGSYPPGFNALVNYTHTSTSGNLGIFRLNSTSAPGQNGASAANIFKSAPKQNGASAANIFK